MTADAVDTSHASFWQRPLTFPPGLEYERRLVLSARALSPDRLTVTARLVDAEHEGELELEIDPHGIVQVARVTFKGPFPQCAKVRGLGHRMLGLSVVRDQGRLPAELANVRGCFHALELAAPAFRFATNVLATARVGWDVMHPPGPETYERMREAGCDRCLAFEP